MQMMIGFKSYCTAVMSAPFLGVNGESDADGIKKVAASTAYLVSPQKKNKSKI